MEEEAQFAGSSAATGLSVGLGLDAHAVQFANAGASVLDLGGGDELNQALGQPRGVVPTLTAEQVAHVVTLQVIRSEDGEVVAFMAISVISESSPLSASGP